MSELLCQTYFLPKPHHSKRPSPLSKVTAYKCLRRISPLEEEYNGLNKSDSAVSKLILTSLQLVTGAACVAAVERLPALHYSVDFIFLSFGIMGFIVEL